MRIPMPQLRAIIYAQDRTNDAKFIASSIKDFFSNTLDDRRKLLSVAVPAAKAYKEATTLRVPVHCHERKQLGKMLPAYEIMHRIVYEIFPGIEQKKFAWKLFQRHDQPAARGGTVMNLDQTKAALSLHIGTPAQTNRNFGLEESPSHGMLMSLPISEIDFFDKKPSPFT